MKIGIDISQVVYETGVSVYTRNLVQSLLSLDTQNEYVLFSGTLRRKSDVEIFLQSVRAKNMREVIVPLSPTMLDVVWNKLHLVPLERMIGKVDVFHSSDWTQPPTRAKKVTTVHDLAPILYPLETDPKIVEVHNRRLHWVKREVDAIIVPSKSIKQEMVNLDFDERKIHVIYEAAEDIFKPSREEEINAVLGKYNISQKYYLMVGANRRKNIANVIQSFESLKDKDTLLVIIGNNTSGVTSTNKNVRFLGHVSNFERPALYSGALSLVYPSLYEGFGFPILESFACGTPVITSNLSSMKEIAGNAAILVDPKNVDEIADAMEQAIKLSARLREKGFHRMKQFSWKKAAKETLRIYTNL